MSRSARYLHATHSMHCAQSCGVTGCAWAAIMHCSEIACTVFDAVRDCWMMICAANSSRLARPLAQFDADGNGVLDRQELMSFLQVGGWLSVPTSQY